MRNLDHLVNTSCTHRVAVRTVCREEDESFDEYSTDLRVRLALLFLREELELGGDIVHDLRGERE